MLVSLFPGLSLNEAVGAYITAAVVILLIGVSGTFDRLMRLIPKGIAAGMMAGILFQFGTHAFAAASAMPVLAFSMIAIYVVGRRWWPRYCIVVVLLAGIALAMPLGLTHFDGVTLEFTHPVFIAPHWALSSTLSLAIPLVVVSLTGQFLPGMAVLRGSGYDIPAKPIMTATSVASISVAFFGGITIVIARFMPFIRTFAPFVAGVAEMGRTKFTAYNVGGALIWVLGIATAGYFFGNLPFVRQHLDKIIWALIFVPGLLAIYGAWRASKAEKAREAQASQA